MAPFIMWIQAALLPSFPVAESLPPLDTEDHITVIRKRFLYTMGTLEVKITSRGDPNIIMQAHQHTN